MTKNLNIYHFIRVLTLIGIFITSTQSIAQFYLPNSNYYHSEVERFNLSSTETTNHQKHLSVKPILDSKSNRDSIYYSSRKVYYTLTQK